MRVTTCTAAALGAAVLVGGTAVHVTSASATSDQVTLCVDKRGNVAYRPDRPCGGGETSLALASPDALAALGSTVTGLSARVDALEQPQPALQVLLNSGSTDVHVLGSGLEPGSALVWQRLESRCGEQAGGALPGIVSDDGSFSETLPLAQAGATVWLQVTATAADGTPVSRATGTPPTCTGPG